MPVGLSQASDGLAILSCSSRSGIPRRDAFALEDSTTRKGGTYGVAMECHLPYPVAWRRGVLRFFQVLTGPLRGVNSKGKEIGQAGHRAGRHDLRCLVGGWLVINRALGSVKVLAVCFFLPLGDCWSQCLPWALKVCIRPLGQMPFPGSSVGWRV